MFKIFSGSKKSGPIDFMVVGLGNPGLKYEGTRHNAGFMSIDMLAKKYGKHIKKVKFKGATEQVNIGGKKVLLLKPMTYMNLSGEAVIEAMKYYKLTPEQIVVVFDDIMLDVGKIRVKRKGSDGGQKGIRSIMELCKTEEIARVKVGIGKKPHPDYDLAKWVMGKFSAQDLKALQPALEEAVDAIELVIDGQIDEAMSRFNRYN